jgi:hypothetical protein
MPIVALTIILAGLMMRNDKDTPLGSRPLTK